MERNQKTMGIPNPFRCHVSSCHLDYSETWLSGVPFYPYLEPTTAKSTCDDAAGQSWGFPSNSFRQVWEGHLECFPGRGLSTEQVENWTLWARYFVIILVLGASKIGRASRRCSSVYLSAFELHGQDTTGRGWRRSGVTWGWVGHWLHCREGGWKEG